MGYTKERWEKIDRGDRWEIICPHPSGQGRQSLGSFRKDDLTPIVDLIVAIPLMHGQLKTGIEALSEALNHLNGREIDEARDYIKGVIAGNQLAIAKAEGRVK